MKSLWTAFCILISVSARASQFVGATTAGLGGAGTAAVENIDSLYLNPAALASTNKLYFGSGYTFGSVVPDVSRETYSLTMSDGSPGVVIPGAFGYKYHRVGIGEDAFKEQEFKVGVGFKLHPRASLGVAYSHIRAENSLLGEFKQKNIDLGLLMNLKDRWGLAVTAEGLVRQEDRLPEGLRRQSRWGLGTQFDVMRILQLRYDLKTTLHRDVNAGNMAHNIGLGFLLRGYFQLNFGVSVDDIIGQNWWSSGLVWSGPKLKLGYSLQDETRMGLGMRHFVDLWLDL